MGYWPETDIIISSVPISVSRSASGYQKGQDSENSEHHVINRARYRVPAGEVYCAVESPRGELAFYIIADGSSHPYRAHVRAPSFANLQVLPVLAEGSLVADVVATIGSLDPVMGEVDR